MAVKTIIPNEDIEDILSLYQLGVTLVGMYKGKPYVLFELMKGRHVERLNHRQRLELMMPIIPT